MALIQYKKAGLKFLTVESFSAGIVLSGAETKALRAKQGSMDGSRVVVRGGEAFVLGLTIPPYQVANTPAGYKPDRPRKLLLSKKEIAHLSAEEAKKGLTIVPLEVYNSGRFIKVRVAVVRGKRTADKREALKKQDASREMERAMRAKR